MSEGELKKRLKNFYFPDSSIYEKVLDTAKKEFPEIPHRKISGGELDDLSDYWVATQEWFEKYFGEKK